jgi:hypothetical protein
MYIPESGAIDRGRRAGNTSDGDKEDSTGAKAPRNPDQHGVPIFLDSTWKKLSRDSDALVLLDACVQLRLGPSHPHTNLLQILSKNGTHNHTSLRDV